MAQNDLLRRYLDAGMQFTQMTQRRAEAIVRDLVKAGEVQAESTQALASDLFDRSKRNSEKLVEQIRSEIRAQIANLGLATKDDLRRLEHRIDALAGQAKAQKATKATKVTGSSKAAPAAKKAVPAVKKAAAKPAPATKKTAGAGGSAKKAKVASPAPAGSPPS